MAGGVLVLGFAGLKAPNPTLGPLFLCSMLAVASWRHSTRLVSLSASALMQRDRRDPVLFFRSFEDESLPAEPGFFESFQVAPRTLEMVLASVAWSCGPVITCGIPGMKLPPLGFARDFLGDPDWRSTASHWIDEAQIIFLMAGRTRGVGWEMNTLAERGELSRVVVVIPPLGREERCSRWGTFLSQLNAPVRERLDRLAVHRALAIVFSPAGDPLMLTASRRGAQGYECALQVAAGYVLANGGYPALRDPCRQV
jgi:hypothetical protein